jgi:DNA-binding NarL/FixJ family response regulator
MLSEADGLDVVAEADSGRGALDIARKGLCDVMLLDISMPGQNGVDILRAIKRGQSDLPVLIFSGLPAEQYAVNVLRIGADGFLDKYARPDEIERAIRTVAGRRRYISSEVGDLLARSFDQGATPAIHTELSDREFQVFLRLAKGELVSEIAQALSLSAKTISTYRTRVLEKMALHSNSDMTYYAIKSGLLN